MLNLTVASHNNRKALIIRDTTPLFSELQVAEGWGTDFDFATYIIAGSQTATLEVVQAHYDGTTQTETFDLTALGFFESVSDQTDLIYNLINTDGTLTLVSVANFDPTAVDEIPDGIYTFTYTLTTSGDDITYTTIFVAKDKAVYILEIEALNLDDKIFSSNTDLVQLLNLLIMESITYFVDKSNSSSDADNIINMLKIVNNEEYEYYRV